ncbi:hypothetical protein SODALDRAFT_325146 [Sodiomyces alkalinus F11]|uniref:Cenp-O kinetochore centromere component n=1 Tax=Sodiomyces alkalinus (strain CBS 110278 / VKM F-3762 / F11) TaxID=1314773 RepID=A0A3N2PST3_SODAK|nr:hypothetical protein SODALDRAFT_325146 [Sodiomyces alkalinus F11]ROT37571.1 hypothetical protein SODALDRAFT_325146 [Sodiomyces alkalinus F11]
MTSEAEPNEIGQELDYEIEDLQSQIATLKRHLKIHATTILSADSTRQLLLRHRETLEEDSLFVSSETSSAVHDKVLSRIDAQHAHDQQCLYRTGAAVTTFKVRDPDPNAVDNGSVLGLRFEVMSKTRFLRPYYVMLNRPYPESRHLRVHRHTVPPCIPLPGLAARYLPAPSPPDATHQAKQDLLRFVRHVRREIVRYHNRAAVIGDLAEAAAAAAARGAAGGDEERGRERREGDEEEGDEEGEGEGEEAGAGTLVDVRAADPQAKQVSLAWADGRTGRLVMDDDGGVDKVVVFRYDEQDGETRRELVTGEDRRLEDVVRRVGWSTKTRTRTTSRQSRAAS